MDSQSVESSSRSNNKEILKEGNNMDDVTKAEEQMFPKRSKGKVALIMLSLCLATLLAALDVSIVTTALPSIAAAFHSTSAYTWVGSSYLLATAAATPIWGKVSDIFGRKPALIAANVIFLVGSLVAGLANSVGMLIAARAVQGLGGGGLLVLCNIVIGDLFSEAERGAYYGILGGVWAVALAMGPVLGGAFAENVTWRWCFYFNLPLDGLALVVLIVFLDLKTPRTPLVEGILAMDWLGALLIIGGTLMFLFGLEYGGETFPWFVHLLGYFSHRLIGDRDSTTVICLIVFGLVSIILFVLIQWKVAQYPIMPLRLFTSRTSLACFGVNFFHGLSVIVALFYLPLFFQGALGATPILSGVYLMATAISMALAALICGMVIAVTGNARLPMYVGLPLMTLGFGLFIDLDPESSWAKIIIYQIICGLGLGPIFQAPLIVLQSVSAPQDVATATSSFEFCRNLATSIGVVVGGVIFDNKITDLRTSLSAHLPASTVELLTTGGAAAATAIIDALPTAQKEFAQNAYSTAIRPVWYYAVAGSATTLLISLLISKKELAKEHAETVTGLEAEEANRQRNIQLRKDARMKKAQHKGLPGKIENTV